MPPRRPGPFGRAPCSRGGARPRRQPGATTGFADFLSRYPDHERAEDAAYLRIIALQRHGDHGSMQEAAQEYLRLYPSGFRYAEVERLSR